MFFFLASVRMFDLRHLEHSTIIYEDPTHTPLLRLAWNKQDPNYLATVAMDACEVIILDVRVPCTPVARYEYYIADTVLATLILLVQAEGSFFSRSHFLRTIHFTYAPKNHKRSTKISMILVRCHTLRDFHKRSPFLRWL